MSAFNNITFNDSIKYDKMSIFDNIVFNNLNKYKKKNVIWLKESLSFSCYYDNPSIFKLIKEEGDNDINYFINILLNSQEKISTKLKNTLNDYDIEYDKYNKSLDEDKYQFKKSLFENENGQIECNFLLDSTLKCYYNNEPLDWQNMNIVKNKIIDCIRKKGFLSKEENIKNIKLIEFKLEFIIKELEVFDNKKEIIINKQKIESYDRDE